MKSLWAGSTPGKQRDTGAPSCSDALLVAYLNDFCCRGSSCSTRAGLGRRAARSSLGKAEDAQRKISGAGSRKLEQGKPELMCRQPRMTDRSDSARRSGAEGEEKLPCLSGVQVSRQGQRLAI